MFFILSHELFHRKILRGFVSKHGDVYFKAADVASLIGKDKLWATRWCKTRVSDIFRETGTVLNLRKWIYRMRVFTIKETAFLLSHFPNAPPFARLMGHKLERRGAYARVLRNPVQEEPGCRYERSMKGAPRVLMTLPREEEDGNSVFKVDTLRNFLNDFSEKCESFYIREEEEYKESIKRTEWLLKVSKKGYEHPPRLLKMQIGGNSFQYILV